MKYASTTALALVLAAAAPVIAQEAEVEVEVVEPEAETEAVGAATDAADSGEAEIGLGEAGAGTIEAEVITLSTWDYEPLYAEGIRASNLLGAEVRGANGEEIGEIEDLIMGPEGQVLAAIAEVGGFLDIGDTHVSVPWDEVETTAEGIMIPVTEETVDEYGLFERDWISAEEAAGQIMADVDDAQTGPRAWRVQELIGDYVRLAGEEPAANYGYVDDLIIRDGEIAAVVAESAYGYAAGYRAYPYFGWGYGWRPGSAYYDLPYAEREVGEMEPFEYERLER